MLAPRPGTAGPQHIPTYTTLPTLPSRAGLVDGSVRKGKGYIPDVDMEISSYRCRVMHRVPTIPWHPQLLPQKASLSIFVLKHPRSHSITWFSDILDKNCWAVIDIDIQRTVSSYHSLTYVLTHTPTHIGNSRK